MKRVLQLSVIFSMSLIFLSCSHHLSNEITKEIPKNNEQLVQVETSGKVQSLEKVPTTEEIVSTLCSDEFEGRLVGSEGNEKTGEYISNIYKEIGLVPFFKDNYYEPYTQAVFKSSGYNGSNDNPERKEVNNVIGVIKGKDSKKAVIISSHFDHIGYVNGKIIRGALDNASGMAALIKIANSLKERSIEKPFDMDIIICAFNGEECGSLGSQMFVAELKPKEAYESLYNINIDSICSNNGGKLALKNKSKVSDKLYDAIKTSMRNSNIEFEDTAVKGVSDHLSFERALIPNVFIVQEGIENLVHKPTDNPDTLDYEQLDNIANAVTNFVETNNGISFEN